ncbi:hypothetical protein A1O3_04587 [Capronia epimyces CBS 606.96]|uniref:Uncharacterized protein n=1 Tax=Capronia epimyces CBS 606.96 TaxID=1182542 RepID=W9YEC7_9EURO|nr:uncharacterized protein A1O3_04587 [Capronia epimyces CBS 606.96]EXJ87626.1 hypothetical protein A1O3_04587 [Capronia epimyces CBS 606.96]
MLWREERSITDLDLFTLIEPQVIPHEGEARKGAEAKQTNPAMDPIEDEQHHQVSTHSGLFFLLHLLPHIGALDTYMMELSMVCSWTMASASGFWA